jgi:ATP-dependent Clp protease ATP-binding subunit ClpB
MNVENMTIKLREAIQSADTIANDHNNSVIDTEHILLALLQQKEGMVRPLFEKLGGSSRSLEQELEQMVDRLPKSYGSASQRSLSNRLGNELYASEKIAGTFKDEVYQRRASDPGDS